MKEFEFVREDLVIPPRARRATYGTGNSNKVQSFSHKFDKSL
jgi:hypothetical protein